jgi:hypothetical protein
MTYMDQNLQLIYGVPTYFALFMFSAFHHKQYSFIRGSFKQRTYLHLSKRDKILKNANFVLIQVAFEEVLNIMQ